MKKIIASILVFILIVLSFNFVYAESGHYKINLIKETESVLAGKNLVVKLNISNIKDVGDGVNATNGYISYNSKVLEVADTGALTAGEGWDSITYSNNYNASASEKTEWNLSNDDKVIAFSNTKGSYVKNDFTLLTITFKVLDSAKIGDKANVKVLYLDLANDNDYDGETLPTLNLTVEKEPEQKTEEPKQEEPKQEETKQEETKQEESADFSKAKFELKKDGRNQAILEISGVTAKEQTNYYWIITSNSSKPNIEQYPNSASSERKSLSYDKDKKIFQAYGLEKYVELNQDIYVSVVEGENIVSFGNKLTRFEEPKYTDAFFATFMSDDYDQIVTNYIHDESNDRKIEIKIGKVTDTSILQKIKDKNASGFEKLLTYAKANSGIFDKTVDANKNDYSIGYVTRASEKKDVINLTGLENEAYYFLYLKTDDENGKFISNETVTLAKANVFNDGKWSMFFYGNEDFKWSEFSTDDSNNDNTTLPRKIDQAGESVGITIGILATVVFGVVALVKYKKNNF